MDLDPLLAVAGLFVGFVIGLTGMGGGALMTPVLVLFFGVQPLAAVSSDLLASLVMKPVGGAVHARRGTVDKRLVGWLCLGSVPAAFAGVLVLRAFGDGEDLQRVVKLLLGAALLLAVVGMVAKGVTEDRRRARDAAGQDAAGALPLVVRPLATVLVGAFGGFIVGMTSVGSGSLIIVLLLVLHPRLTPARLVGTDLVQAVPLVGAATLGHLLFGDVQLDVTGSLLLGALPGVYLGARASTVAPARLVRNALVFVLLASALKLLEVPNAVVGVVLVAALVVGLVALLRHRRTGSGPGPGAAGSSRDDASGPSPRQPEPEDVRLADSGP